jgi:hypothetical protein
MKEKMLIHDRDPGYDLGVVVEDDERVAYGYLLKGEKIISDVWLYNRGSAPVDPEWTDPDGAPFRNPVGYVDPAIVVPANSVAEVTFRWTTRNGLRNVDIFLRGTLLGRLEEGSRPGWAALARVDGPLARVLQPTDMTA